MKKISLINEGRLIDYEMSYIVGGEATSCPNEYSSGTPYCSLGQYDSCSQSFGYGSTPCPTQYN